MSLALSRHQRAVAHHQQQIRLADYLVMALLKEFNSWIHAKHLRWFFLRPTKEVVKPTHRQQMHRRVEVDGLGDHLTSSIPKFQPIGWEWSRDGFAATPASKWRNGLWQRAPIAVATALTLQADAPYEDPCVLRPFEPPTC